jgi:hypothetical protein
MTWKQIKRWNRDLHRDIGYFVSTLIISYCISGIALNHVNDWNPDFILSKKTIAITDTISKNTPSKENLLYWSKLVGESSYKLADVPAPGQLKIYYDKATLHIHFHEGIGIYESIQRRPLFYETNVLHRNTIKGWKWASDVFALLLIGVNLTGLFILKGKYGIAGRGKWLILAGFAPIVLVLVFAFA